MATTYGTGPYGRDLYGTSVTSPWEQITVPPCDGFWQTTIPPAAANWNAIAVPPCDGVWPTTIGAAWCALPSTAGAMFPSEESA